MFSIYVLLGIFLFSDPNPKLTTYLITWWNVENLFDPEDAPKKQDEDFTPSGKYSWTKERLHKKLKNLSKVMLGMSKLQGKTFPDIAGFAEVEHEHLIKNLYRFYLKAQNFEVVYHETNDVRGIDVCLVYNKNAFPIAKKKIITVKLKTRPTRDILQLELISRKGESLYVFANHWSSRRGGQKSSEYKRIKAARTLRREINFILKKNPHADIIVMGDFNDEPFNKSLVKHLKATGNLEKAISSNQQKLFNFSFSHPQWTVSHKSYGMKLDQMLGSRGLFDKKGFFTTENSFKVFVPKYLLRVAGKRKQYLQPFRTYQSKKYLGGYSDHLPLWLTIFSL